MDHNGSGLTTVRTVREPRDFSAPARPLSPDTAPQNHNQAARYEVARVRLLAGQLHQLGPRAMFELILELLEGADVLDRLEAYAAIDRDFLHALGGEALPPHVRAIGGAR